MAQDNVYKKGFLPYGLGAFLIGIVGGFTSVFSPAFVQEMGLSYSNTTWTALAQAMSSASCAPILGKVGDLIGRKRTLILGILVFTLGTVLSALASSLLFMLGARFLVGVGTAAIGPTILAYIATEFPRDRVAKGFSLYMLLSSASVILGPSLGGIIIASYGWRFMMWVCVGICGAVFAACFWLTRQEASPTKSLGHFDRLGSVIIPIFFSLVLCIPSFGQNFGWTSPSFLAVLGAAFVSLVVLLPVEQRAEHPILSGEFMKRKAFILSIFALFLTQGLMQANMTNTIVFVNYTRPGNTAVSGYAISVMYIGMSLGAVLLGPLADRIEPKKVLTASLLFTGAGCALLLLFSEATPTFLLMASLGILGFGLGANGTIFMKVCLSGLSRTDAGSGTGTYGLFRDLSAPFGVAVFVPLFTNQITSRIATGMGEAAATVASIHSLAITELICVAVGILAVLFLPRWNASAKDAPS